MTAQEIGRDWVVPAMGGEKAERRSDKEDGVRAYVCACACVCLWEGGGARGGVTGRLLGCLECNRHVCEHLRSGQRHTRGGGCTAGLGGGGGTGGGSGPLSERERRLHGGRFLDGWSCEWPSAVCTSQQRFRCRCIGIVCWNAGNGGDGGRMAGTGGAGSVHSMRTRRLSLQWTPPDQRCR
jgi:hypothetical protein